MSILRQLIKRASALGFFLSLVRERIEVRVKHPGSGVSRGGISDADLAGNNPFITMKFPKKILLIDHEPGVTRLIRRALERAGKYLIREEHDDKLALNAARWFQPDLILVDTAGQDRRNIEREIHTDAALKDTPVLSLSNLRPESQMVSGGILSGYSFFAAPIRVEEVLRGVDELLFGKD